MDQIKKHKNDFDPNNIRDFVDAFIYEQRHGTRNTNGSFKVIFVRLLGQLHGILWRLDYINYSSKLHY